jgi:hypothetical protein
MAADGRAALSSFRTPIEKRGNLSYQETMF